MGEHHVIAPDVTDLGEAQPDDTGKAKARIHLAKSVTQSGGPQQGVKFAACQGVHVTRQYHRTRRSGPHLLRGPWHLLTTAPPIPAGCKVRHAGRYW